MLISGVIKPKHYPLKKDYMMFDEILGTKLKKYNISS